MRRVVKVGGSLLVREDLRVALPRWIACQSKAETLVIVGGGELIDAIRNLDRAHGGDPVEIHWLCVDLLETTFRLFSSWFDWECIRTHPALLAAIKSGFRTDSPTLVSVSAFYDRNDSIDGIPLDWRTTSDTIAALLAQRTAAEELVLLKSCPIDSSASIQQLADLGIIDEALPCIESTVRSIRVESLG